MTTEPIDDHGLAELRSAGLVPSPLARRGFVMTSLMSGLTLATTRVEAQVIHTDAAGLIAGEARIPVSDEGTLPGYFARPSGVAHPPIVLVNEEVFGVHDYIKDICRRLAHLGYFAIAPEIYARLADMAKVQASELPGIIARAPDATVMSDLDAAVSWAASQGGDAGRLGVVGFCRGGRNTWLYDAHAPTVRAAVAFYGPVLGPRTDIQPHTPTDVAAQLHAPLLGLYGGQDANIRPADVEAAAARARAAGKTVELVIYPEAPHGFHADYRPSFRPTDASDAWARMLAWFKRYGVG